jgi:hypothetical protein
MARRAAVDHAWGPRWNGRTGRCCRHAPIPFAGLHSGGAFRHYRALEGVGDMGSDPRTASVPSRSA